MPIYECEIQGEVFNEVRPDHSPSVGHNITIYSQWVKDFNTIATSKKDSHTTIKISIPYDV